MGVLDQEAGVGQRCVESVCHSGTSKEHQTNGLSGMVGAACMGVLERTKTPHAGNDTSTTSLGAHLTVGRRAILEDRDRNSSGEGTEAMVLARPLTGGAVCSQHTTEQSHGVSNSKILTVQARWGA